MMTNKLIPARLLGKIFYGDIKKVAHSHKIAPKKLLEALIKAGVLFS